jgi:hypothetical protein
MRADMQHTRCIADATGMQRHLDDLLLHICGLPRVAIVQQKRPTGTGVLAAAVALFALPGLAMADNIRAVTMRTMDDLKDHEATQSSWGC